MVCKRCGKQIPDTSNVCQYCGVMLTQRNISNAYNSINVNYQPTSKSKVQKKTPWHVIVVSVAVLLVLMIAVSVLLVKNKNLKDELADKEKFSLILAEKTDKPVVDFMCKDFDSDGTREAYVVVGDSDSAENEDLPEYYDADIYYVNHKEAQMIKEKVSGKVNGLIENDERLFVSYEIETEGNGYSYIYTSESNEPAESEISGMYSDVHQKNGKIYGTDDSGETIRIEIPDVIKNVVNGEEMIPENVTKENPEETSESVTTEADTNENLTTVPDEQTTSQNNANTDETSLYKSALSNGGLSKYSSGAEQWSGQNVYSQLIDLNGDGIDELYMYMGTGSFPMRYLVFAIQNGKVVRIMEKNDGSGRGYGDVLYLTKKADTGTPVIVARLGLGGSSMYTSGNVIHEVYTYNGSSLTLSISFGQKIISLSDPNFVENPHDEYRIGAEFVSESDYENGLARYGMSSHGPISTYNSLYTGTYNNPIQ